MIGNIFQKFKRNPFDDLLKKAAQDRKRKFLILWNRGLGDVALGLYALIQRIKHFLPEAQITFLTRRELEDAFQLLEGTRVIGVPWWERGKPIDREETFQRLHLNQADYDIILERLNPTEWLKWQIGTLSPKLTWKGEFDSLWEHFAIHEPSRFYIGVHIDTETRQFYGYKKDWPMENWRKLLEIICNYPDIRIILFGLHKTCCFNQLSIIDLRGETNLLEMLSIIKNRCQMLIAPDGGVLSLAYYLDVLFPITVISLWGDAHQGILKQSVPSPNQGLVHIPLIGKGNDISQITVEEVLRWVQPVIPSV